MTHRRHKVTGQSQSDLIGSQWNFHSSILHHLFIPVRRDRTQTGCKQRTASVLTGESWDPEPAESVWPQPCLDVAGASPSTSWGWTGTSKSAGQSVSQVSFWVSRRQPIQSALPSSASPRTSASSRRAVDAVGQADAVVQQRREGASLQSGRACRPERKRETLTRRQVHRAHSLTVTSTLGLLELLRPDCFHRGSADVRAQIMPVLLQGHLDHAQTWEGTSRGSGWNSGD